MRLIEERTTRPVTIGAYNSVSNLSFHHHMHTKLLSHCKPCLRQFGGPFSALIALTLITLAWHEDTSVVTLSIRERSLWVERVSLDISLLSLFIFHIIQSFSLIVTYFSNFEFFLHTTHTNTQPLRFGFVRSHNKLHNTSKKQTKSKKYSLLCAALLTLHQHTVHLWPVAELDRQVNAGHHPVPAFPARYLLVPGRPQRVQADVERIEPGPLQPDELAR